MKLREIIRKSLFKGSNPSSSRIMAYCMMSIILLFGLTCIIIELVNSIKVWNKGDGSTYTIPTEHIVILGMWLAHQLTLLGIYKSSENKPKVDKTIQSIEDNINEVLP